MSKLFYCQHISVEYESSMNIGQCQLCLASSCDLQASHVWPRNLYKNYVSDHSKGGQFVDLAKQKISNRQYVEYWFCKYCEQILQKYETYAAEMTRHIETSAQKTARYDANMLAYATSISFRSWLYTIKRKGENLTEQRKEVFKRWRRFLLGKESDVGPYTQHVFCIFKQDDVYHQGIGGQPYLEHEVIISQAGPLLVIGILSRENLTMADIKILEKSQISKYGGSICTIENWHLGQNITEKLLRLLAERFRATQKLSKSVNLE